MTLSQKIIVFQWFLGFVGAAAVYSTISTIVAETDRLSVQARVVETVPIIPPSDLLIDPLPTFKMPN